MLMPKGVSTEMPGATLRLLNSGVIGGAVAARRTRCRHDRR